MKILLSLLIAAILFTMSMIDMRGVVNPLVDCKVGEYTFTLKLSDCIKGKI